MVYFDKVLIDLVSGKLNFQISTTMSLSHKLAVKKLKEWQF